MPGKANSTYGPVLSALLIVMTLTALISFFATRKDTVSKSTQFAIQQQRPPEPLPEMTPAIEAGKKLFNQYCLSCHNFKRTHATILGFENRGPWADRQKLWEWLVDPKAFMKKDRYTAAMYEEFQVLQTPFPDITRQQSDQIADYLIYVNKTRSRE